MSGRPYPLPMGNNGGDGGGGEHRWSVEHAPVAGYFWVCSCGDRSPPVYMGDSGAATAARQHARHHTARSEPDQLVGNIVPQWRHA